MRKQRGSVHTRRADNAKQSSSFVYAWRLFTFPFLQEDYRRVREYTVKVPKLSSFIANQIDLLTSQASFSGETSPFLSSPDSLALAEMKFEVSPNSQSSLSSAFVHLLYYNDDAYISFEQQTINPRTYIVILTYTSTHSFSHVRTVNRVNKKGGGEERG